MKRRRVVAGAGAGCAWLAMAWPARARSAQKIHRIGCVLPGRSSEFREDTLLRDALRALHYEAGRNLRWERRFTGMVNDSRDQGDRLHERFAELVKLPVDLILAFGDRQASAARAVTSSIPVVMHYSDEPQETGLVASLAHPGGNVTGMTTAGLQSAGKSMQLLAEMAPAARQIGVLLDPYYSVARQYWRAFEQAADRLGRTLTVRWSHSAKAIDASLLSFVEDGVQAFLVAGEGATDVHRAHIIGFAARHRLPALYPHARHVSQGGLMARNADDAECRHRVAAIIDRILKGTSPAGIALEQPNRFVVSVNRRTAAALGLPIPQSVLLQATTVVG